MLVRKTVLTLCGLVLSAGVAGCSGLEKLSSLEWPEPEVPDVHPIRKKRADDAVAEFDRRRNEAQYLAAQSSWRQGDYARCRESLEKVGKEVHELEKARPLSGSQGDLPETALVSVAFALTATAARCSRAGDLGTHR